MSKMMFLLPPSFAFPDQTPDRRHAAVLQECLSRLTSSRMCQKKCRNKVAIRARKLVRLKCHGGDHRSEVIFPDCANMNLRPTRRGQSNARKLASYL